MSAEFAKTAANVLSANGLKVTLSDRAIPTPALSFTVRERKLDLGIMITASHNPPEYNGFKIKNPSGGAASQDVTDAVEALLGKNPVKTDAPDSPGVKSVNLVSDYIKFIRSYIDLKKSKTRNLRYW